MLDDLLLELGPKKALLIVDCKHVFAVVVDNPKGNEDGNHKHGNLDRSPGRRPRDEN